MPAAEARIPTPNAGRYLTRLCQHAGKMGSRRLRHRPRSYDGGAPPEIRHAECSDTDGTLVLNWGQCTLHAADGMLTLRAQAGSADDLARIQDLIAGRLEKFGRREQLTVTWQLSRISVRHRPGGKSAWPAGRMPRQAMSRCRWCGTLSW